MAIQKKDLGSTSGETTVKLFEVITTPDMEKVMSESLMLLPERLIAIREAAIQQGQIDPGKFASVFGLAACCIG